MADSARLDELQRKYAENPRRYFAPLANEYRKAGELSTAVQICRDELARYPGHMSGHVVLGQALYESRRPTEAQAAFERALALDPENLIALRHLGDIARDRGDLREARSWYERVLEADPRNDDIAAQLSRLAPVAPRPVAPAPVAMTPIVPPTPGPSTAPTPLLEPLEWTALDLGLPGDEPAPRPTEAGAAAPEPAFPHEAGPQLAVGSDALLDFDPSQLAPLGAMGEPVAEAPIEAAAAGDEPFSTISDEVSVLAGGLGVDVTGEAPESIVETPPAADETTSAAEPEVPVELEAAVLRWDDLLPSLDEAEEDDAEPAPAAPELADVTAGALDGAEPEVIPEGDDDLALRVGDDESEVAEVVEPAEVLAAEAADARVELPVAEEPSPAPGAPAWMVEVEEAWDVEAPAPAVPEPAAMSALAESTSVADETGVAEAQPSVDEPAVAATGDDADLYDFLVPFDAPGEPAADVTAAAQWTEDAPRVESSPVEASSEELPTRAPAVDERPIDTTGAPAFAAFELATFELAEPEPAPVEEGPIAPEAELLDAVSAPTVAYDPVVGLDVPPAPPASPVPPVLAEAAAGIGGEEGASPAPAGAFVTETMAVLLSQQGHLEQALDVYARLEAQRPQDEALRGRADALRARVHAPPAPVEPDGSPNAAAFFASLAFDAPAEAHADVSEPDVSEPDVSEPDVSEPVPAEAPVARGFFDAPADAEDERAAARLARAVGVPDDETSLLVSTLFTPRATPADVPSLADTDTFAAVLAVPPAVPPADAPYGLAEFSFERFFAGLEEGVPGAESAPEHPASAPAVPAPEGAWAAFASPAPADAPAAPDATPPAPPSDDEDLAQFNAWLKGLIGP